MRLLTLALGASLTLPLAAQDKTAGDPGKKTPPAVPSTTKAIPRSTPDPEKTARDFKRAEQYRAERLTARKARQAEALRAAREKAEAIKNGTLGVAKVVVPAESSSDDKLPGTWILQSESLGRSLTEQFQKAAGRGMNFTLGKLSGDYLAEINPDKSKITIHWKERKMESVAKRDEFKATLAVSVTGKQEYKVVKLTSGENPGSRKILLELTQDDTKSQSFFQGTKIRSKVDLPGLTSGHWSISEGVLHLQGTKQEVPWQFTRKPEDAPEG